MDKIKLRIGERFKSRKLALSCFVMLLGASGFLLVGKFPGLAVVYPEFCMFLLGASTIYVGGNTAAKFVQARTPSAATQKARESKEHSQS